MKKERVIGLDLFRILLMIMIFNFHTNMHAGVLYGKINSLVCQGAIVMEAFFLLSGYCIGKKYDLKYFEERDKLFAFYVNHIVRLLFGYWLVLILNKILCNDFSFSKILMYPFELLGLTQTFANAYNWGSWFVSVMLFCYLFFPFLLILTPKTKKNIVLLVLLIYLLSSLAPVAASVNGIDWTYPRIFWRVIQFWIGIILAQISIDSQIKINKSIRCFLAVLILIVLFIIVVILNSHNLGSYGSYEFITLPLFSIIIVLLDCIKTRETWIDKIIIHFSKISYGFYLAQTLCFLIFKKITDVYDIKNGLIIILINFLICFIISEIITFLTDKILSIISKK